MKKITVCVNLDSLALGSGWELASGKDPTYKLVDERLIGRLENAGIKVILFAVGKDLESTGNREYLKKWSRAGHEIGNHSYSHPLNLGSLTGREIEIEIKKTDVLIKEITGYKPRSFNAPGWAESFAIDRVLLSLDYKVDYSPFQSWWIYPLLLKQWWSLRGRPEAKTVWGRRERREQRSVASRPLPIVRILRIPVWHTGWFIFGEKIFPRLLKSAVKENPEFYYLMHPADVIGSGDIPRGFEGKVIFERLNVLLKDKIKYVDLALGFLL